MKTEIVKKGKYNRNYFSATFESEKKDYHWRNEKNQFKTGINIMFKHSEICQILKDLIHVEPEEKRLKLVEMFTDSIRQGLEMPFDYNK